MIRVLWHRLRGHRVERQSDQFCMFDYCYPCNERLRGFW